MNQTKNYGIYYYFKTIKILILEGETNRKSVAINFLTIANSKLINNINPAISPRANHIENYLNSKSARNTFVQVSTLKNIDNRTTNLTSQQKKSITKKELVSHPSEYLTISQKYISLDQLKYLDKSQLLDSSLSQINDSKMLARAVSAGHEVPERISKRMEESKQIFENSKNAGKDALIAELERKELENHVKILENRLMKLHIEEKNMHKKILDTSDKTEKTLQSKLRHQEELTEKEMRRAELEHLLDQKRQELNDKRENDGNTRKIKTQEMLQERQNIATNVKDIKQDARNQKVSNKTYHLHQSSQLIQKIRGEDNTRKTERFDRENEKKMINKTQFHGRLQTNKETKQNLESKLKELEEQEQLMVEKLKQTYNLHKNKYEAYQRVFNAKVTIGAPIDMSIIHNISEKPIEPNDQEFDVDQDYEDIQQNNHIIIPLVNGDDEDQ